MPRRVNPALLFGLVAASVLLFALSASAAPEAEAQDTPVEVPEGTFKTFEGMLNEGEAEYGEYKNVDFEEGLLLPEITQTRSDLANAESGLEEAKNERDEKLKEVYTRGQDRFMRFLLEAKDFRQFANLLGFGVQALKDDQEKVQEWRERKAKVEKEKEDLETQLPKARALKEQK